MTRSPHGSRRPRQASRFLATIVVACCVIAAAAAQDVAEPRAIRIEDSSNFEDLEFLRPVLESKRVVLLGESNHGAREFNLQKNRLIRFLHERLDYRVLLLESGIGEVYSINYRRAELSKTKMLAAGLIGPWRSTEYVDLMDYLKRTPGLYVGGYDVQRSGRSFRKILAKLDGHDATLEPRFDELSAQLRDRTRKIDDKMEEQVTLLRGDYGSMRARIERQRSKPTEGWAAEQLAVVAAILGNRATYLDYFLQFKRDNNFRTRWRARDVAMAANVLFFARELFPKQKIVISGHNFHIARHNTKEHVMGEILAEVLGDSMYAVGVFAGRGTYANNSRKSESIDRPTEKNDIQHRIAGIGHPSSFLHVPPRGSAENSWLFAATPVNNTFLDLEGRKAWTLGKAFDGLVLIDRISPARYQTVR